MLLVLQSLFFIFFYDSNLFEMLMLLTGIQKQTKTIINLKTINQRETIIPLCVIYTVRSFSAGHFQRTEIPHVASLTTELVSI